jgi:hypothetical protein
MLTIVALVDADYSPDEHAKDIIENTRRLFSSAEVTVLEVQAQPMGMPELNAGDGPPR